MYTRDTEGLKHDLGHLLSVGFGVTYRIGQQHRVFLRGNTQLIVEGVMPDLEKRGEDGQQKKEEKRQKGGAEKRRNETRMRKRKAEKEGGRKEVTAESLLTDTPK